jgi:two-component system, NarL family, invasion response regulator UvrY
MPSQGSLLTRKRLTMPELQPIQQWASQHPREENRRGALSHTLNNAYFYPQNPLTTSQVTGNVRRAQELGRAPESDMDRKIRILLVDDHYVLRQGLKTVLSEHYAQAVFGECGTAQEALDVIWKDSCDVVLLDISIPGRGGLEVLKEIRKSRPKLPVIIVSMHPEEQFAIRVLKLGACSYVRKDSAGQELVKAVGAALRGGKYISPALAERLAANLEQNQDGPRHECLSDREYQVMCLLASGKTVKEIGGDLSLSVKTVSTYRSRILEKLLLKNNSQLMRYAVRYSLVDVSTEV